MNSNIICSLSMKYMTMEMHGFRALVRAASNCSYTPKLLRVNVVDTNERHLMIISLVECRICYYRLTHFAHSFVCAPPLSDTTWILDLLCCDFSLSLSMAVCVFVICFHFAFSGCFDLNLCIWMGNTKWDIYKKLNEGIL